MFNITIKNQTSHWWLTCIQTTEWFYVFSFSVDVTNEVKKPKNQCHTEEKL